MIRQFQPGDILLLQRLSRQAAKLNSERALTSPRSASRVAWTALLPWSRARVITEVLRQQENRLAHAGLIQLRKRPERPEADVIFLAPDLDTPNGHPAIWQKLLVHSIKTAADQGIDRFYVDLPDQPLPLDICGQVGFTPYTRETIWRLAHPAFAAFGLDVALRPSLAVDQWHLHRLYHQITPEPVQQAEGGSLTGEELSPPILQWWQPGHAAAYVLEEAAGLTGALLVAVGTRAVWLQLWCDTLQSGNNLAERLLRSGFDHLRRQGIQLPVYVGVRDYQAGLRTLLESYGFAPYTDRVRLAKQIRVRARSAAAQPLPRLESVRKALPTPLAAHAAPFLCGNMRFRNGVYRVSAHSGV